MKPIKSIIAAAAILSVVSCTSNKPLPLIPAENFRQSVDGKNVDLYTLKAGDLIMQVTNFGGRGVALQTPDRNGSYEDIVLGFNNLDNYVDIYSLD